MILQLPLPPSGYLSIFIYLLNSLNLREMRCFRPGDEGAWIDFVAVRPAVHLVKL